MKEGWITFLFIGLTVLFAGLYFSEKVNRETAETSSSAYEQKWRVAQQNIDSLLEEEQTIINNITNVNEYYETREKTIASIPDSVIASAIRAELARLYPPQYNGGPADSLPLQ